MSLRTEILTSLLTLSIAASSAYVIFSKLPKAISNPSESKQEEETPDPNPQLPIPPPLKAADHIHDGKHHLLLAATGSVATIKIPQIIRSLSHHTNLSIRLILTESATEFLRGQSSEQPSLEEISRYPNVDAIYRDRDEWRRPWTRGADILHIELRRWADLMVVAPLSANALAKLSLGLSDSLLYSVARAWDVSGMIDEGRPGIELPYAGEDGRRRKGIVVAPAMNTAMWHHPATAMHLGVLEGAWNVRSGGWVEVLRPIDKGLACGDKGGGGMREWMEIVGVIEQRLQLTSTSERVGQEN